MSTCGLCVWGLRQVKQMAGMGGADPADGAVHDPKAAMAKAIEQLGMVRIP